MGYKFQRPEQLSFHHLIVPKKDCKEAGLGDGYLFWNGAVLTQSKYSSSHDYFHTIALYDEEIAFRITQLMIEENQNQRIDIEHLRKIRDLLLYFEKEHCSTRNNSGGLIIRRNFIEPRIEL